MDTEISWYCRFLSCHVFIFGSRWNWMKNCGASIRGLGLWVTTLQCWHQLIDMCIVVVTVINRQLQQSISLQKSWRAHGIPYTALETVLKLEVVAITISTMSLFHLRSSKHGQRSGGQASWTVCSNYQPPSKASYFCNIGMVSVDQSSFIHNLKSELS